MTSYCTARSLDAQEQHTRLVLFFPGFRRIARGNPVIWEGTVQPIGGTTYKIQIEHKRNHRPLVRVVEPALERREADIPIPHTFKTGEICLHLRDEWTSSRYIHETIVPWTVIWLFFYEVWRATGQWLGGGHEPANDETEQPAIESE
jgi:hypothetical protein